MLLVGKFDKHWQPTVLLAFTTAFASENASSMLYSAYELSRRNNAFARQQQGAMQMWILATAA